MRRLLLSQALPLLFVTIIRHTSYLYQPSQFEKPPDSLPEHDSSTSSGPSPQRESQPGWSIKEHPLESVNGRFLVLTSRQSKFGGEIYRLLFTNSPYLVVDVWVYDLEPGGQPDIRSFIQYEMDAHAHQSLVNFCRAYIDDPIFSK